jgi:hypothetical protein
MRFISRDEFLRILKLPEPNFDHMQRNGQAAMALGTPLPAHGRYLDLDLVAMAITMALAPTVGRETAATIVLGFFNVWGAAVGQAEVDPLQSCYFAIGAMGGDVLARRPDHYLVTSGTEDEIIDDLCGAHAKLGVSITDILARLRANGREIDVDLSQPFFFPPDHPRFTEVIAEFRRTRDERIARLRRDKKKSAQMKERMREPSIRIPSRLRNNPLAAAIAAVPS